MWWTRYVLASAMAIGILVGALAQKVGWLAGLRAWLDRVLGP